MLSFVRIKIDRCGRNMSAKNSKNKAIENQHKIYEIYKNDLVKEKFTLAYSLLENAPSLSARFLPEIFHNNTLDEVQEPIHDMVQVLDNGMLYFGSRESDRHRVWRCNQMKIQSVKNPH